MTTTSRWRWPALSTVLILTLPRLFGAGVLVAVADAVGLAAGVFVAVASGTGVDDGLAGAASLAGPRALLPAAGTGGVCVGLTAAACWPVAMALTLPAAGCAVSTRTISSAVTVETTTLTRMIVPHCFRVRGDDIGIEYITIAPRRSNQFRTRGMTQIARASG